MSLANLIKSFDWNSLENIERDINRIFHELAPPHGRSSTRRALNLWTDDDAVHVEAELPGVDPKELDVTLENRTLTIRGVRKSESLDEGETILRRERAHGEFARSIVLPVAVDPNKVKAASENGILRITMPIAEAARARKIKVS